METQCLQVLFFTILLWVSIFGAIDTLVSLLEDYRARLIAYLSIGLATVLAVSNTHFSVCSLL